MQYPAHVIADLVDAHRIEAHRSTSIAEKVRHIEVMAQLRRLSRPASAGRPGIRDGLGARVDRAAMHRR